MSEHRLSERERQVLSLVRAGKTTRQIAEELRIKEKTAGSHRQHVMEKLGVHKAAQLLALAMVTFLVFGQRNTPDRPPYEFGVEKCSGNVCVIAVQVPGDAPDQFRVEVRATRLADRALVTVLWETNPGGTPEIHVAQGITNKTPTIQDKVPAVAEFKGVPRVAVSSIRVALAKVEEVERQEFK